MQRARRRGARARRRRGAGREAVSVSNVTRNIPRRECDLSHPLASHTLQVGRRSPSPPLGRRSHLAVSNCQSSRMGQGAHFGLWPSPPKSRACRE